MPTINAHAQSKIQDMLTEACHIIDEHEYRKAYDLLCNINEQQLKMSGDSCIMVVNFQKGQCLYWLDKYEEAIPFFLRSLSLFENMPHNDCSYIENIYCIGSCYKNLKQYKKAEEYFRRVIIRGNVLGFECEITNHTLSELTEVYANLGNNELADQCTAKISNRVHDMSGLEF